LTSTFSRQRLAPGRRIAIRRNSCSRSIWPCTADCTRGDFWLDVVEDARKFAVSRHDPPGKNLQDDAFELLWHKTMFALLAGARRPDLVLKNGAIPLRIRIRAVPAPDGTPCLIDPWIELAGGFADEQWSLTTPSTLASRAPAALKHYDEATKYESTRAEALVRKAWLLARLGRAAEALTTLDAVPSPTPDPFVLYWSRLFRGRALEDAGRLDDAIQAYKNALDASPGAQSPAVAMAALELGRGRLDQATKWADEVRHSAEGANDPWWQYDTGDNRFLQDRLSRLRAMNHR